MPVVKTSVLKAAFFQYGERGGIRWNLIMTRQKVDCCYE